MVSARPADASEAESRRAERFQDFAGKAGLVPAPEEEPNPSSPMTLDLRWPAQTGKTSRLGIPAIPS